MKHDSKASEHLFPAVYNTYVYNTHTYLFIVCIIEHVKVILMKYF